MHVGGSVIYRARAGDSQGNGGGERRWYSGEIERVYARDRSHALRRDQADHTLASLRCAQNDKDDLYLTLVILSAAKNPSLDAVPSSRSAH